MAFNIFGDAPQSLTGLLGEQATQDLQKKALTTGLINAAIGYIAQPKNQRFGSALPYIGRALMAGQEGAQGVYSGAIKDWELQQKIEEMKRQKSQREAFDAASKNLYTTTPAQFETMTTPGGYAPQQTQVMPDQVAPNYAMTRLPDITSQRQIAPASQQLNQDALQQLMLSGDPRATSYLSGLKTLKELTTPAKADLIKAGAEEAIYDPNKKEWITSPVSKKEKPRTYTDTWANVALNAYQTDNPAELTKEQRDFVSQEVERQKRAGSPSTVIKMPAFESEYDKKLAGGVAETQLASYQNVDKSVANINKIDKTLSQLQTSQAITGFGADVVKNVDRFKAKVLADKNAGKRVSDTEILDSFLGSDVFPQIGALGIGAKGLDTPAEREFLRQVMTGTISMDKNALIKMTKIRRDIEERAIQKYNTDVEQGKYDRFFRATGFPKQRVSVPSLTSDGYSAEEVK